MKSETGLRKIKKVVLADYDGYLLVKYLKKLQPSWTKIFAMKMIRTKNVLVNGRKIPTNYKVRAGDKLELYGSVSGPKNLNLKRLKPLNIVYEDDNVVIVDKELKIPVQEDDKHPINNMNNRLANHLNWDSSKWKPTFIHRLDYNTTGLLIGAKNFQTFNQLTTSLKEELIGKRYRVIVHGLVKFKKTLIKVQLLKKENRAEVVSKGGKEAITEVHLVKHLFEDNSSVLEVNLITGRTHQVRASLANIGHPVRGDQKYGVEKDKKKYPYPALCAYKLSFSSEIQHEKLSGVKGKEFIKEDIWFLGDLVQ